MNEATVTTKLETYHGIECKMSAFEASTRSSKRRKISESTFSSVPLPTQTPRPRKADEPAKQYVPTPIMSLCWIVMVHSVTLDKAH